MRLRSARVSSAVMVGAVSRCVPLAGTSRWSAITAARPVASRTRRRSRSAAICGVGPKAEMLATATFRCMTGSAMRGHRVEGLAVRDREARRRTSDRARLQAASVRIVRRARGGKPASRRAWSTAGLKAAMTLPELVQCGGKRRPT